ncbi:MAG: extracellular solute-binding protein [Minwuia sp.]|nr:extracellular solute-binding protein [Minwuia sp.]
MVSGLKTVLRVGALVAAFCLPALAVSAETIEKTHALSLIGDPKYPVGFDHLGFANPDAPKGGTLRMSAFGGFDSLNPFIAKGNASGVAQQAIETLMETHLGEPSTEYGLIAETVEVPADDSWVIFNLRAEARFHDGSPVTAEDVIFSFERLKEEGRPFYRYYYRNVVSHEILGPRRVKFTFSSGGNRELPQIMGQLPVMSKAWWDGREFGATTLDAPLGSGPYRVAEVEPNRRVVLERVKDYWGKDLGLTRGRYNFDRIRYEYFADHTAMLEAFKANVYDFRLENRSLTWATGYDFPAREKGLVKLELVPHSRPTGMQGFFYNTRRPVFANQSLRQALSYAFDFELANQNLFYGQYTRTQSYFSNTELASTGLPSEAELVLLDPLRDQVPDAVFTEAYVAPSTAGRGGLRTNLRLANKLLLDAGYVVRDMKLIDPVTNEPVTFEILLQGDGFKSVAGAFKANLARLGVQVTVRIVDSSQYENRVRAFDFDMIIGTTPQSESPGNEQRNFFGSEAADREGSGNLMGIKSPAVDELIGHVIFAKDREALVTATRALDRVLLHSHIVIPQWHISASRIAYWDKFGRPDTDPAYGVDIFSWWIEPAKAARVGGKAQ